MDSNRMSDIDEMEDGNELEDSTVGDLQESIETNLWLAEGYFLQGASGLGVECLRSAWLEYVRFRDVLGVYGGTDLGKRLVEALVFRAGDDAAALAFGGEAASTWRETVAA